MFVCGVVLGVFEVSKRSGLQMMSRCSGSSILTLSILCMCFQGKQWNGKIHKKKEFVIDKRSKMKDLKLLIANLLRKTGSKSALEDIVKNISVTKGFSATPMRASNIDRLQWVHRAALYSIGVDHDRYFYKIGDVANQHSEQVLDDEHFENFKHFQESSDFQRFCHIL